MSLRYRRLFFAIFQAYSNITGVSRVPLPIGSFFVTIDDIIDDYVRPIR
jgi:hypothetical protein